MGGWLLRAAEGFTGRANSALAVGDPGLPLPDAVARVESWYADRGLRPAVALPYPTGRPTAHPLSAVLDRLAWPIRHGPALVMTAAVHEVLASIPDVDARQVRVEPEPDDGWLSMYHYRGKPLPPIARRLLLSAPWQVFASVWDEGAPVAIGRAAVADGWAGLTAIEVVPECRRRGLATVVTAALVQAAARHGASSVYLQVEEHNTGARALYGRCGFVVHHGYHYRLQPPRGA